MTSILNQPHFTDADKAREYLEALCNLNALFAGEQAPFPEAFELKVDPPPEVADLRRQIRAAFEPPNQSSPQ